MKKFMPVFSVAICLAMLFAVVGNVAAVKPVGAGAITVPWNLSSEVMPVPPYGLGDIPGSDIASKLIVNQPNGNTEVTLTGVMSGLNPNTTYTVYLAPGYTPYVDTGWNLNAITGLQFNSTKWPSGNPYQHTVVISGSSVSGTSTGNTYDAVVTVTGDSVNIVATYKPGSAAYPYTYTAIGTISAAGVLSGTWTDTANDSGTWNSNVGTAVKTHTGSNGFPGFFSASIPTFTFTTDATGAGSWHLNVTEQNYSGTGTKSLSVWINGGGRTILVSDSFNVIFE